MSKNGFRKNSLVNLGEQENLDGIPRSGQRNRKNRNSTRNGHNKRDGDLLFPETIGKNKIVNLPLQPKSEKPGGDSARSCIFHGQESYFNDLIREKDARIELLIKHNRELTHHITTLEDLIGNSPVIPEARESEKAPVSDAPPQEEQEAGAISVSFNLIDDHRNGWGASNEGDFCFTIDSVERGSTVSEPVAETESAEGESDESKSCRILEQRLEKEKEAKKKIIQEFMELSAQGGEEEKKLRAKLEEARNRLADREMRLVLTERHLEDIKAAKLELKKDHENLLEALAFERSRPWWKKLLNS
jgi:hypothetical protein